VATPLGRLPIAPLSIALVPLDDRPCNRQFPQQLAEITGGRLALPPREHLGWFTRPGNCEAIAAWLQETPADRLVISLDMLCYGGLVASRSLAVGEDLALSRLAALRDLRQARPELTIYASSIVMRLGTAVASPEALPVHQALCSFSQLVDRVERLGDEAARPELEAVAAALGPALLAEYLGVRRRNHGINRAAVGLVADGVLDYLILAQEDAAPVGIHMPELSALRTQAEEFRVSDRIAIHPGADEAGLTLLARHHLQAAGRPVLLAVDYATAEGAAAIPEFEHQPLYETVVSHIRAAGARLTPADGADAVLFVHTPTQGQSPGPAAQAESLVERTRTAQASGLIVGLADVAQPNGADPELVAALRRSGGASHLSAFAGWNTAANTLGTAISQLCLSAAGPATASGAAASARFLACRLIDDYGYQSCVRPRASARASAAGANPYALGEARPEMEGFVRRELEPFAHETYSDLLDAAWSASWERARVSLPWHRLFEVEVDISSA